MLSFQYAVHPLFYCCSIGHYKLLTLSDKWYRLPPRFALVHNDVWTCHLTFPTAIGASAGYEQPGMMFKRAFTKSARFRSLHSRT